MGLEGLVIILRSLLKSSGLGLPPSLDDVLSNNVNIVASNAVAAAPWKSVIGGEVSQLVIDSEPSDDLHMSNIISGGGLVENFDGKQKILEEIETGILKFSLNPKKGLQYLVSKGHLEYTPEAVAVFFHTYKDRLDKAQVGEFLGREREYENGFCLKVLHDYVDKMDFQSLRFDEAIRAFLSGFRIPGEAQKIDRIMEKFSERYYLQNKHTFASADMAFILAFSTIMLQTNLHNPAIKDDKRMTKEQFIKQNKGISADGELPESLLIEIYENIAAKPLTLPGQEDLAGLRKGRVGKSGDASFSVFSGERKRKDAYQTERTEVVKVGEQMIKQSRKKTAGRQSVYVRASVDSVLEGESMVGIIGSDDIYVKPMFDLSWAPMLGVLSQVMEVSEDDELISTCITGFLYAIRLSSRLLSSSNEFLTARQSFVNALARFTTLETIKEMKAKNVECIKALIYVALCDAEYLDESWFQVLQCLSQLVRLQLLANGLHDDGVFLTANDTNANIAATTNTGGFFASIMGNTTAPPLPSTASRRQSAMNNNNNGGLDPFKLFSQTSKAENAKAVEETNALLIAAENINDNLIDRIITNTQYLTSGSVCHFIDNLCEVSKHEIASDGRTVYARESESNSPRIFCLQKLVEVAGYNMHLRHRVDWARMWSTLATHFSNAGCHSNKYIAMYAIDSLKQLSIKFLQKEELSNFNFQQKFLKPFEVIMTKSKSFDIKEIVLNCIDVMIKACANNIRSGWKSIFSTLAIAVNCKKLEIAKYSYDIIERLLNSQFHLLVNDFVDIVNCLVTCAGCQHLVISSLSLAQLSVCGVYLVDGTISIMSESRKMISTVHELIHR